MNILFAHPYFPGQFDALARHLVRHTDHDLKALSSGIMDGRQSEAVDGIETLEFGREVVVDRPPDHVLNETESFIRNAASLALVAEDLKQSGWSPDVIYVHASWGVGAFLHEVFPKARFIKYCEWFYGKEGSDTDFFDTERSIGDKIVGELMNLPILAEFSRADRLISPTLWQRSQFPHLIQPSIDIVADGIDMELFKPDGNAIFTLADGRQLRKGDRVVTYVARGADPYRGFETFIKALSRLQASDPDVEALIAGDRTVYYGAGVGTEAHFHEVMQSARLDPARTHFVGRIAKERYIELLQVSSAHIYLTVPFVLSWSALQSMATGCLVIGSDTQPVREFISHGENGLLCGFDDEKRLAELMATALEDDFSALRQNARKTMAERWSLDLALKTHLAILEGFQAE